MITDLTAPTASCPFCRCKETECTDWYEKELAQKKNLMGYTAMFKCPVCNKRFSEYFSLMEAS